MIYGIWAIGVRIGGKACELALLAFGSPYGDHAMPDFAVR